MGASRFGIRIYHLSSLCRISLQASHDRLQVSHINTASLFFVKKVEDVSEVLYFIFCEATADNSATFFFQRMSCLNLRGWEICQLWLLSLLLYYRLFLAHGISILL